MSVERRDPSTMAIAGGSQADLQRAIESDFRIRSGMCPNGCGLMTELDFGPWTQECPKCHFSCNTPAEKGAPQ